MEPWKEAFILYLFPNARADGDLLSYEENIDWESNQAQSFKSGWDAAEEYSSEQR